MNDFREEAEALIQGFFEAALVTHDGDRNAAMIDTLLFALSVCNEAEKIQGDDNENPSRTFRTRH